jgi:hypothetical protein
MVQTFPVNKECLPMRCLLTLVEHIARRERPPADLPKSYIRACAHHEAGHAIAGIVGGLSFEYVTIKPEWSEEVEAWMAGHVKFQPRPEKIGEWTDAERRAFVITTLAGPLAQARDQKHRNKQDDVFNDGAATDKYNTKLTVKSDAELSDWYDAAVAFVEDHWSHIRKLAIALQQRSRLTQDEVWDLITEPEKKLAA